MGHADRHCHSGCRYADHIDLALGGVAGFHRQVAVGGGQRAVVYRNAGVAFGGKPGVAYADPHGAQSRLHGPQVDGVFLIFRHIALPGRQGHAGAFHGGVLYGNIVQLVQVVHRIRHVYLNPAQGAAATVQFRVVQLRIVHGQGSAGSFQRGAVLHIGMHPGAVHILLVFGVGVRLHLFLHLLLFRVGHAVEVFGKIPVSIVVDNTHGLIDGVRMAEGRRISVCIFGIPQVVDPAIDRNGRHVHRKAYDADADAGYGRVDLPLGFGVYCQGILCLEGTLVHNSADAVVEGADIHSDADAGYQGGSAGTGGILYLNGVGRIHFDGIRFQRTACNAAGDYAVNIVHGNAAGHPAAEHACRQAHRHQLGFQLRAVGCAYRQGGFGRTAPGLVVGFDIAVFHVGGHGGMFLHQAHAHIQGTGPAVRAGRNSQARVHVQVVDPVLVAGLHFRISGVIHGSVGHRGKGGTFHPVDVHVIAGLKGEFLTAGNSPGHVKGRHGLLGICSHVEILGVNGIFLFTGIDAFVVFLGIVPLGRRRGDTRRRYPAHLVDRAGKACRDAYVFPDAHGGCAAEFRYVGVIRRMDIHVAAGRRGVQFGIQHFRRGRTGDLVQVDHTRHGSANDAAVADTCRHAAVSHDRSNGMGSGSVHHHAGLFFFHPALLQPADAVFFVIPFPFREGAAGPGVPAYGAVDQVFIIICIVFQLAGRLNFITVAAGGCYRAVADQGGGIAADLIIGSRYADGGGKALPAHGYVQHPRIVGDGFVAPGHYPYIACAADIRFLNFRRRIIFNIVMAAGTAGGHRPFRRHGSAHGHAEDIPLGSRADIQVPHVHGCGVLLIRIGHPCGGGILDAVYAYRHYPRQEGIRPGQLQGRRTGLQGGRGIRFHRHQSRLAAAVLVDGGILQACRIGFVNIGVRPHALGGKLRAFHQARADGYRSGFGCIRYGSADDGSLPVLLHGGNIRVVNFRTDGFFAVALFRAFIAFRQGHAYP